MLHFNIAQTFTFNSPTSQANNDVSSTLKIISIQVYFMYKPPSTGTRSGIEFPGLTLYLTEVENGVPKISSSTDNITYLSYARVEWNNILTSSDSSLPTKFTFQNPVTILANKEYAFVLSFDGNETFWPWTARVGKTIVGTSQTFSGSNMVGKYFETNPGTSTNNPSTELVDSPVSWRALLDTELKFSVTAARYFINGVPVSYAGLSNTIIIQGSFNQSYDVGTGVFSYYFPSLCMEQISFDADNSSLNAFIGAQRVYQNTVFYPGGSTPKTVTTNSSSIIVANNTFPNGASFDWASDVYNNYNGAAYITLFDNNYVNIRRVITSINSTALFLDEPVSFSNSAAKFMITPVATISSFNDKSARGKNESLLFLQYSNANSTVRFVNTTIEDISITTNGTGYNNSDIIVITGYEHVNDKITGGYNAYGNVATNGSGAITAIYLTNTGCGFTNTSDLKVVIGPGIDPAAVTNATTNTSGGSSATFSYDIGATLCTELTTNIFKGCEVVNLEVNDVTPFFEISAPTQVSFSMSLMTQYFVNADTSSTSGYVYYVQPNTSSFPIDLQLYKVTNITKNQTKMPAYVSYSNEFNVHYSNGSLNDKVDFLSPVSNNFVVKIDATSTNDYVAPTVDTTISLEFSKFVINNDYTNEHLNNGLCWAKHITTKIPFTRLSEDLRVYLTTYKPIYSDFQVYARLQNSADPQAFDDEDWTRLELIDGKNIISSSNKDDDYIDLTFGLRLYPNVEFTVAGAITTTNNSTTITGTNTLFDTNATSNLVSGDMVRIYSSLFANDDFMVAVINTVTNDTSLTIDRPILSTINPNLVNPGLKMDKLGYPHQVYNDITNSNIASYYNMSLVNYDGFDTMQVKICLLSSDLKYIPRIHDVRVLGLSA